MVFSSAGQADRKPLANPQFFKSSRDEKVGTTQAGLSAGRQGERRRWAFFNSLFIADKPYKNMLKVGDRSVSQERRRLRDRLSDE